MEDDVQLLAEFAKHGSEEAFARVVSQHADLVFTTALRIVGGDVPMAEDVTQGVFADLARKARFLSSRVLLSGWLYEATRFAAAKAVRSERRRKMREQESMAMHALMDESRADWEQLYPIIDVAMGRLSSKDRNAVLLRFFERQDLRTVGIALGISEDAAQKRVGRALDKLRLLLVRRGVILSGVVLAGLLTTEAVQAAPPTIAKSVAAAVIAGKVAPAATGFLGFLTTAGTSASLKTMLAGLMLILGGIVAKPYVVAPRFTPVVLRSFYNGKLDISWVPNFDPDSNLAALPRGKQVFAQVPFEVGGIIQLQGREWEKNGYNFPKRVDGIPVHQRCHRLHLLHASSAIADPVGTVVASMVLHYDDGEETQIDLRHGEQIADWWAWGWPPPQDTNTVIAWTGQNPAAQKKGTKIQLLKSTFVNPLPARKIESIDYVSAMAGSAPFMVSLTLER